jgi:hypothetical protein
MSPETSSSSKGFKLSLDTWAVILALALALLVRIGAFTKVPW